MVYFSGSAWLRRMGFPLGLLLVGIGLLWAGMGRAQASVDLSGTVTGESGVDGVTVRWTTGPELGTKGFYLLRSTAADGPFQPVPICVRDNKFDDKMVTGIFAQGDVAGFSYEVVDLAIDLDFDGERVDDLVNGVTYYYLLIEQDGNGYTRFVDDMASVTYSLMGGGPTPSAEICPDPEPLPGFDPIPLPTATTQVTATLTPTVTPSPTPSVTVTPTLESTLTFTPTPTPTFTPTFPPTFTPTFTPTPIPPSYPGAGTTGPTPPTPTPTGLFTPTTIPGSYPGPGDATPTETPTVDPFLTPTLTETLTIDAGATPTETPTLPPSATPTDTPTITPTPTETGTPTPTPTRTPTPTATPTRTPVPVSQLLPPPRIMDRDGQQIQSIGQPPAPADRSLADLGAFAASLAGLGIFFLVLALWQMGRRSS